MAELVAFASRLTPWRVSSADSRLALFWAFLLAVAPAMLLSGLTLGLADRCGVVADAGGGGHRLSRDMGRGIACIGRKA